VAAQLTAFQRLQLVLARHAGNAPDMACRALAVDARRDLHRAARSDVFYRTKIPIDPLLAMLGGGARRRRRMQRRAALGLDKPLIVQFLIYVRDVCTATWAWSAAQVEPV